MRYQHAIPCDVNTTIKAYLSESGVRGDFEADLKLEIVNNTIPVTIMGARGPGNLAIDGV